MSGTELFATFLGSVALLLWGVRMVRTGMTRAFGAALRRAISVYARTRIARILRRHRRHRRAAELDRHHLAARLVRGARADRAAARARRHPRRRRRLGGGRAGVLARREVAVDRAGRARRAAVHVDRSRPRARRRAHLHRSRLHAARAGPYRPRGGAAEGLRAVPLAAHRARRRAGARLHRGGRGVVAGAFEPVDRAAGDVARGGAGPPRPARARTRARRQCRRRARAVPDAVRLAAGRPPRAARQPDDAHRRRPAGAVLRHADRRMARDARIRSGPHRDQLPHRVQSGGGGGVPAGRRLCGLARRARAARSAAGGCVDQAEASRSDRAGIAVRGARLRDARDTAHGRPCRRNAAPGAGGVRAIRPAARQGGREIRQRGRRTARGDQALHGQGLEGRDVGRGKPALCRDHHLHDQSRACRRHHRQEPDGARRQEDQEPLHLLSPRGWRRSAASMPA